VAAFARHRVEHDEPAAALSRLFLDCGHQRHADATSPRGTMHQHLLDVGAMALVRRRVEGELHGADDFSVAFRREQDDVAASDRIRHFLKKRKRLFMAIGRHEIDAGAALHAIDQDISKFRQSRIRYRRGQGNDLRGRAHAARSSLEATVASAFR
jgi:hypothetical protein